MNKRPNRIKQLRKEQLKTERKNYNNKNSPAERLLEVRCAYLSHLPLHFIIHLYISIKKENTDDIF